MSGKGGAMFMIVGFAGLLMIVAVFSGWQGTSRLTSQSSDAKEVEEAARAFVEAYGTFDFREPDLYRRRLLALTTGPLWAATNAAGVDPVAVAQQRTMATEVISVSVSAMSGDQASTTVTAEQRRRFANPEGGVIEERVVQRVTCLLQREDGRWLVAQFRLLSEEPAVPTPGS